jgi:Fe-S-cluster containining protein
MENNENKSLCSGCGECCKRYSGILFPEQLEEVTIESIDKKIKEGYCFDNWIGNPSNNPEYSHIEQAWFLRPQHTNRLGRLVDESWGGICIFHSDEKGCSLTFNERPLVCQSLIPSQDRICKPLKEGYSKMNAAIAWLKYDDVLNEYINTH